MVYSSQKGVQQSKGCKAENVQEKDVHQSMKMYCRGCMNDHQRVYSSQRGCTSQSRCTALRGLHSSVRQDVQQPKRVYIVDVPVSMCVQQTMSTMVMHTQFQWNAIMFALTA